MKTVKERFWDKVDVRGENECWNWLAGKSGKKGYGRFCPVTRGKQYGSHRLCYEWTYGVDPGNLHVLHTCDNPACVNPKHLFLGTPLDNITDCISKGRFARGVDKVRSAKLAQEDVERIREMVLFGATQRHLSNTFGVSPAVICKIVNRKIWKHVGA